MVPSNAQQVLEEVTTIAEQHSAKFDSGRSGVIIAGGRGLRLTGFSFSGEEGNRTPDLLLAKQALYQLSYFPASKLPAHPAPHGAQLANSQCAYLDSNQGPQLYQSCALAN